jgi:hypothetical protein
MNPVQEILSISLLETKRQQMLFEKHFAVIKQCWSPGIPSACGATVTTLERLLELLFRAPLCIWTTVAEILLCVCVFVFISGSFRWHVNA